jgi:energy-coupling factor transporter ATP-binding protein EcfA2
VKLALRRPEPRLPRRHKTVFDEISGGATSSPSASSRCQPRLHRPLQLQGRRPAEAFVGQLSGGERGRLHLAKTLISGGNVLLLDEPSNDLDVETLRALEDALLEFAGSVMVISHDRWFLDRICTHILACEGDSQWTFFNGNYQEYEADKRKRLGEEGAKPKRIRYKPDHPLNLLPRGVFKRSPYYRGIALPLPSAMEPAASPIARASVHHRTPASTHRWQMNPTLRRQASSLA